ncbi:YceI family protein [Myxococcus llanfairpwllgwyngyllgogerychwyrndrobwllllantysiliogogogochensis]|uniref:YceI family protein n=1 Tax=Myxococcus llanfairpwllgwyngyllgogerychwyrndrobwllllantysiliogogogochensis TaxID=2590453 RepID=A0A540WLG2_9BACT|nr:YceI family protein [Myxococcus llanfairpwllgwyngyllgogerychwyrndrobwllllantysiliogogogochensis]TQF09869.1 YceI family protein [Myxococcus llanfairpwllgwyngyllgogerychwyrndrobwllllantysiliogogogochensis]
MNTSLRHYAVTTLAIASLTASLPALAQLDRPKSAVSVTAKQMGAPLNGKFKKFDASIKFDPAHLEQASVQVTIDTASLDLGGEAYSEELHGKDWFDVATYPRATFEASSVKAGGAGKYDVAGKLTIKGHSQSVVVAVAFKETGSTQIFDGELSIKRTQFNVGAGKWKDTSVVADEVVINFHLVVSKR